MPPLDTAPAADPFADIHTPSGAETGAGDDNGGERAAPADGTRAYPDSLPGVDTATLVKGLGWFSVGLGLAEMLAPKAVARVAGLEGHETLLRLFGAREFAAGVGLLRGHDPEFWIRARLAGDALDGAALLYAMRPGNPGRGRAFGAFVAVSPVIAADALCAYRMYKARHTAD